MAEGQGHPENIIYGTCLDFRYKETAMEYSRKGLGSQKRGERYRYTVKCVFRGSHVRNASEVREAQV